MTPVPQPTSREHFHIAIICALPREGDAVTLLFDQFWDEEENAYGRAEADTNTYTLGCIGKHPVVLAILPNMGTNSAASSSASLRSTFTRLKLAFIVGICGGVPQISGLDAFLGDVVVSKSIIQYDFGRQYPGSFAIKNTVEDSLGRANKDIRSLLAAFEMEHRKERLHNRAAAHLQQLQKSAKAKRRRAKYGYPGINHDRLFLSEYEHVHRTPCTSCHAVPNVFCEPASKASCNETNCDIDQLVERDHEVDNSNFAPEIFIGRIGSGNTVMKSGRDRDRISAEHNLIAFEMEGTGAWDELPCIVVKGICDYADSHKNKAWQDFAAATAASVMKAILEQYSADSMTKPALNSIQPERLADTRTIHGNTFGGDARLNQGDVHGNLSF